MFINLQVLDFIPYFLPSIILFLSIFVENSNKAMMVDSRRIKTFSFIVQNIYSTKTRFRFYQLNWPLLVWVLKCSSLKFNFIALQIHVTARTKCFLVIIRSHLDVCATCSNSWTQLQIGAWRKQVDVNIQRGEKKTAVMGWRNENLNTVHCTNNINLRSRWLRRNLQTWNHTGRYNMDLTGNNWGRWANHRRPSGVWTWTNRVMVIPEWSSV